MPRLASGGSLLGEAATLFYHWAQRLNDGRREMTIPADVLDVLEEVEIGGSHWGTPREKIY